jgi:hypothetical protein
MTKNEKRLLIVNALYFLSGTMSGVFVNVYLYAFSFKGIYRSGKGW